MTKEKTIVCIGIFLILAVLTSCALYYSTNSYPAVRNGMECSGRGISFEMPAGEAPASAELAYFAPSAEVMFE